MSPQTREIAARIVVDTWRFGKAIERAIEALDPNCRAVKRLGIKVY